MPTPSVFPMFMKAQSGGGGTVVENVMLDIGEDGVMAISLDQPVVTISLDPVIQITLLDSVDTLDSREEIRLSDNPVNLEEC